MENFKGRKRKTTSFMQGNPHKTVSSRFFSRNFIGQKLCWIIEKAREFQKNIYFCFIGYDKAFDCVDHNKLCKFLKRWKYQTTLLACWEICLQVKKQQLDLDMEQQTDSKLGKEYVKAVYRHPDYLIYIQSTSCKMPGWMKHKLESRLLGEMSITSDMQMTRPLWKKAKRNWRASWWSEKGVWKSWLKTQNSEN